MKVYFIFVSVIQIDHLKSLLELVMILSFPVNLEEALHPRSPMCLMKTESPMLYIGQKHAKADK